MNTRSRILVADEAETPKEMLRAVLESDGHQVHVAPDAEQARRKLESEEVDLLIASLVVPPADGFELLRVARQQRPSVPVILYSAFGTVETAVEALKQGAFHYFQEPLDMEAVRQVVSEALRAAKTTWQASPAAANGSLSPADHDDLGIVGAGAWLDQVLELLRRVAPTRATVLLTGESGTGKELFARAIHRLSGRKGPFVAVSCAALSRELLESELFGHEKGAFTGAERQKPGRFELADGGTLLLDEIVDIPLDLQVKLLRVLQEREFERVGGTQTLRVDARIVAACNRDIAAAVRERTFREDLYYRLKVVEISLPPLRERREDIPPLAQHFARLYAKANGRKASTLGPDAIALLQRYSWPGNVRELENAIERTVVLSDPSQTHIDPSLFPEAIRTAPSHGGEETALRGRQAEPPRAGPVFLHRLTEAERLRLLRDALQRTGGNSTAAARLLGASARSVRYYADKYGLWRRGNSSQAA